MKAAAEVLGVAAMLVARNGWDQNRQRDLARAVNTAARTTRADATAVHVAWVALGRAMGGTNVFAWNDAPGRTQADVLAVLDAAHLDALARDDSGVHV